MGLDMYLSARKYVEKIDWKVVHNNNELSYNSPEAILPKFNDVVEAAELSDLATDIYGASVSVTAAYWRKANQIHNWFVKNVQNNVDDCGEYYVSHEKLEELLNTCRQAYLERNPSLLAPVGGFFFGNTDIDQYYWEDVKRTIDKIKKITKNKQYPHLSFYYSSSW
jgi:hypothetical protein